MTDLLTAAREALASFDYPRCSATLTRERPEGPNVYRCCHRVGHDEMYGTPHDFEPGMDAVGATHLRSALARVDELTAEVERLRLAGITCTRGTECHITRGRDV